MLKGWRLRDMIQTGVRIRTPPNPSEPPEPLSPCVNLYASSLNPSTPTPAWVRALLCLYAPEPPEPPEPSEPPEAEPSESLS